LKTNQRENRIKIEFLDCFRFKKYLERKEIRMLNTEKKKSLIKIRECDKKMMTFPSLKNCFKEKTNFTLRQYFFCPLKVAKHKNGFKLFPATNVSTPQKINASFGRRPKLFFLFFLSDNSNFD
jgi:hypothetical protein